MVDADDHHGLRSVVAMATGCDTIARVPTPDELMRQAEALRRVRTARLARDRAKRATRDADDNLRREIIAALATGAAVTDIASAAGQSRQWINRVGKDGP